MKFKFLLIKGHKVLLQACCNKPLLKWSYLYLSVTWLYGYDATSTRREVVIGLLSKKCPPKVNIWAFVKIRALHANATLVAVTHDILSKRFICCPHLVIIIPVEVNYIIMILWMFKNYSVVSIFFRITED